MLIGIEPVIARAGPLTLRWSALLALVALGAGGVAAGGWRPGRPGVAALGLYALARLAIGSVQLEPPFLLGLQLGQFIAIGVLLACAFVMIPAASWRARGARREVPLDPC